VPTESKTLTAARIRKETALSQLRELQLAERVGKLLDACQVEALWSQQMVAIRDAVLGIPARVAPQFADPRHAEAVIRRECEAALRTLSNGR
jgi:phage terminase Nu1 subunit (DNA packaging protein)